MIGAAPWGRWATTTYSNVAVRCHLCGSWSALRLVAGEFRCRDEERCAKLAAARSVTRRQLERILAAQRRM